MKLWVGLFSPQVSVLFLSREILVLYGQAHFLFLLLQQTY